MVPTNGATDPAVMSARNARNGADDSTDSRSASVAIPHDVRIAAVSAELVRTLVAYLLPLLARATVRDPAPIADPNTNDAARAGVAPVAGTAG